MSERTTPDRAERERSRLSNADLTPEQRAAIEARRAERQTPEYQEELARDIEAYRREFPPLVPDEDLLAALAALRAERERQCLSLTDMMERTKIDRATISKLENGKIPNPTYQTLRTYARALGKRLVWSVEDMTTSAEEIM
jgi:ribosome-binding protein aMBF1 (putative translation factor)